MINTEYLTKNSKQEVNIFLDNERDNWIKQAEPLSLCDCITHPLSMRAKIENRLVRDLLVLYPPGKNQRLSLLSIGCGDFLQDYLLIKKLQKIGYDKFDLVFVDPVIKRSCVSKIKELLIDVDAKFFTFSEIEHLNKNSSEEVESNKPSLKFHLIHAIDFEIVNKSTSKAWEVLNLSKQMLETSGIIFCSSRSSKYTFNNSTGWTFKLKSITPKYTRWINIGEEIADQFPSCSKIKCLSYSNFLGNLQVISSFIKKGITDISLFLPYENGNELDKRNERITQEIFPKANITFTSIEKIDTIHDFHVAINGTRAVVNRKLLWSGLRLKTALEKVEFLSMDCI